MIEIGTLDYVASLIGERGTGKSTLAKLMGANFQRSYGGFVIGHSPNGQVGWDPRIEFHDSLRSLEKGVRKRPELMHFIASGATPEDVIDFARVLSKELRRQGHKAAGHPFRENRPAPKGTMAAPVLVIIDEGTHTDSSKRLRKDDKTPPGSTADVKELEKFLTSARHENVGMIYLIQAPTARTWAYMEQSSMFRIFRYVHEWGLNAVRAAAIPKEVLQRIREMPNFTYYQYDKRSPETAGFRKLPDP